MELIGLSLSEACSQITAGDIVLVASSVQRLLSFESDAEQPVGDELRQRGQYPRGDGARADHVPWSRVGGQ